MMMNHHRNDGGDSKSVELECFGHDLTDAQMITIFDIYISTPGVSPLTYLMLRALGPIS